MARYWLTVHWPLCEDEPVNVHWQNWIFSEQLGSNGRKVHHYDRIFIYETGTSPRTIKNGLPVNRRMGRKGIVALATVLTDLIYEDDEPERIEGRRDYYWNYKAKTHTDEKCNINECLSLYELRNILQKPNFCARIPGGLMKLSESQFYRVYNRFHELI